MKDQFDRLYAESEQRAKFVALAIHPYISGQPHRIKYLEMIYDYVNKHDGVLHWNGEQILDWYKTVAKIVACRLAWAPAQNQERADPMGGYSMNRRSTVRALVGAAALLGFAAQAQAQVPEIRLAKQYSMGYLQLNVMEHQKLIEKHAKALGIPEVKVSWLLFNGPAAINDALLSGTIDIASGGVPGLLTLWAKTKGTPQEVRGVSALSSQPFLLNTRNPNIKSVKDFTDHDRIAVPAVKVAVQAITLQMAVAKAYGDKEFDKLDKLTVSMSPPDATIALLGGKSEIDSVFSVPPFQYQQLENPAVHTVINSFDVMGGSHSSPWPGPRRNSATRTRCSTRR